MSELDKFDWLPTTAYSAAELSIGTVLKNSSGIEIKKISDNLWKYEAETGSISYNNNSIDSLKNIDSVFFEVELYS